MAKPVAITYHAHGPIAVGDVLCSPRTYYVVVTSRRVNTRDGRPKWALTCDKRFDTAAAYARSHEITGSSPMTVPRTWPLRWFPRGRKWW